MLWIHDDHPGRAVRLAYCLNLHPAEDVEEMLRGIRDVTLPLRDRLSPGNRGSGIPYAIATSVTTLERLTRTPGPMVELSATRFI